MPKRQSIHLSKDSHINSGKAGSHNQKLSTDPKKLYSCLYLFWPRFSRPALGGCPLLTVPSFNASDAGVGMSSGCRSVRGHQKMRLVSALWGKAWKCFVQWQNKQWFEKGHEKLNKRWEWFDDLLPRHCQVETPRCRALPDLLALQKHLNKRIVGFRQAIFFSNVIAWAWTWLSAYYWNVRIPSALIWAFASAFQDSYQLEQGILLTPTEKK